MSFEKFKMFISNIEVLGPLSQNIFGPRKIYVLKEKMTFRVSFVSFEERE
jgi:hypothetical protein